MTSSRDVSRANPVVKWKPGKNVGRGKDDTLFSLIEGFVKFENKGQQGKFISVYADGVPELVPKAA